MPTPSLGPPPHQRMRVLLTEALLSGTVGQIVLIHRGTRSDEGFEEAWQAAWRLMRSERAWPHRTEPRHQWQGALRAAKPEFRACYLGIETAFQQIAGDLLAIVDDSRFAGDDLVLAELVA